MKKGKDMTRDYSREVGGLDNPKGLKNFKKLDWETVEVGDVFNDESGKVFWVVDLSRDSRETLDWWIRYTDRAGTDPCGRRLWRSDVE